MCGITGFWDFKHANTTKTNRHVVQAMSDELSARGPDASGIWYDEVSGLFLGHRRLSIIDLSEQGAQPMVSQSGDHVITYNGEIFNAPELRIELMNLGISFRGYSDTEVILEACEAWGVKEACNKFNGMFAFGLWSRSQKKLYLARDRIGIKPLYWGHHKGVLFFGSQLKSFKKHPLWAPSLSLEGLGLYLRFNYIKAPQTIFRDIFKVNPGCYVEINSNGKSEEISFWNLYSFFNPSQYHAPQDPREQIKILETLLKDAVKRRLYADVPLGAFLSGGIDSSLVTALMQEASPNPIKTFSIGFEEGSYDEAPYAKSVAQYLKTDHHELYVSSQDSLDVIPKLSLIYDEPFADASQIPTFLVSQLARKEVTVSLSGDGGDELFLGYDRYQVGQKLYTYQKFLPPFLKNVLAQGLEGFSPRQWEKFVRWMPQKYQFSHLAEKGHKLSEVLSVKTPLDFFQTLVSVWQDPQKIMIPSLKNSLSLYPSETSSFKKDLLSLQSYGDLKTYLPECILTKVDRASMFVGLEARVPLLDYRIVEYAASLPSSLKMFKGKPKWPLRKILSNYIPTSLIDRPKKGFSVPIGEWLRGPLQSWAQDLLTSKSFSQGIFNSEPIQKAWSLHLSEKVNLEYALWNILMFQQWKEKENVTF